MDDVEADLDELQDGNTRLVEEHELDVDEYGNLKLAVSNVEATLDDGGGADVTTPGDVPLKSNESSDIREGQRTVFTADVTPVRQGQSGGYVLQPAAAGERVDYENGGEWGVTVAARARCKWDGVERATGRPAAGGAVPTIRRT